MISCERFNKRRRLLRYGWVVATVGASKGGLDKAKIMNSFEPTMSQRLIVRRKGVSKR